MGGRANPLRDAAAIVGIGQTEFGEHIDRLEGEPAAVVACPPARSSCGPA